MFSCYRPVYPYCCCSHLYIHIHNGIPAMAEIGVFKFLSRTVWKQIQQYLRIFPMILGSLYVTAGAIVGVPIGILCSVFGPFRPKSSIGYSNQSLICLRIPRRVWLLRFDGVLPLIRNYLGGSGSSMLAASIVLGIMILPTVIGVSRLQYGLCPEVTMKVP